MKKLAERRNGAAQATRSNGRETAGPAPVSGFDQQSDASDAADALMSLVRELLYVDDQTSDLPLRQLRVCTLLCDGPRSMSELSRELGVSLSAMTQIADRLEAAELVSRLAHGEDRRVKQLQLTRHGQSAMRARQRIRVKRIERVFTRLSAADRKHVVSALGKLQEACAGFSD
jgi:DNA-binding MarR family transcriptional regulator